MRTFVEGMDYNIWKVFKNDYLVTHIKLMMFWKTKIQINFTKEEKEKVLRSLKEKTIITIILSINEFLCVSHYEETKEVCDTLQVINHVTTQAKRD